ncbi:MAG: septum formation initiator family protein [Candidatus Omnitrophica bacterium]|nr:septum formation initiator family protein [Candidatus Omnitrophota bacterium]
MEKGLRLGYWFWIGVGLVALAVAWLLPGFSERRELQEELIRLQSSHEELTREVNDLKAERQALSEDPLAIEREARRTLGFSRSNEITFKKVSAE